MINPQRLLSQMMKNPQMANNPRAKAVFDAWKRKDHDALVNIGNNIFKESGTTLDQATSEFMKNLK